LRDAERIEAIDNLVDRRDRTPLPLETPP